MPLVIRFFFSGILPHHFFVLFSSFFLLLVGWGGFLAFLWVLVDSLPRFKVFFGNLRLCRGLFLPFPTPVKDIPEILIFFLRL